MSWKENKLLVSILLAAVIFILALGFTYPRLALYSQGFSFAELSTNPFTVYSDNGLHFRIFFPFLAWLFSLNQAQIFYFSLVLIFIFLWLVIYSALLKFKNYQSAILLGAIFALTIPLQYTFVYGGFPDALIYLLLLLLLLTAKKDYLFWPFFTAALLTHESVVLLLPFFCVYQYFKSPA